MSDIAERLPMRAPRNLAFGMAPTMEAVWRPAYPRGIRGIARLLLDVVCLAFGVAGFVLAVSVIGGF